MKFSAGDIVSYMNYGVCKVEKIISKKSFSGSAMADFYELKPSNNQKLTIFIPVKNAELTRKMKGVFSSADIKKLITNHDSVLTLAEDKNERQVQYRGILEEANREKLICLIKALDKYQKDIEGRQKKFPATDREALKKAGSLIQEEFSFVLGINKEDVIPYILSAN